MTDTRRPWTGPEFSAFAVALLGAAHGWQSAIARELNVNSRTVRRWAKNGPPDKVRDHMLKIAGIEDDAGLAFPRDEWIIGDGPETESGTRREYIIHARPPRFIARIVSMDELTDQPEPDEDPADILTGVSYQNGTETLLCEFQWIDRPPASKQLAALLEAACDAIDIS